ncbi:MAG: hypothetical protein P8Z68_09260 [Kineosporiaceae bacterium]
MLPTTTDGMLTWLYAHGSSPWGINQQANEDTYAWFAALNLMMATCPPAHRGSAVFRSAQDPGRLPDPHHP